MIAVTFACFLTACDYGSLPWFTGAEKERYPVKVKTLSVKTGTDFDRTVYLGKVEPRKVSILSASVAGTLVSLKAEKGDVLGAGREVARIKSSYAESAFQIAQATYKQARDGYDRVMKVYREGVVTEVQRVDVETKLAQAKASLDAASKTLEDCRVTVPYTGVVNEVFVKKGEDVPLGKPILSLVDVSDMELKISVHENVINNMETGTLAVVEIPALGIDGIRAFVKAKEVLASSLSHSYGCALGFDEVPSGLMPGMAVKVRFDMDGGSRMVIPASAVQMDDAGKYVWLDDGGVVRKARIEGFIFLWTLLFMRFPIRRKLRPLREMAESAQALTMVGWEQEKMQNLTYAISHVDAESGSPRLVTNDSELAGIENAMNDLLSRMRDSYREQTRFVSDASHELRTPIAVIKGYADMLDRWGKEDKQVLEEGIEAIRAESDRMNVLVEQLLFLARGDAGRQNLVMEPISLTALMREVYDESVMIDHKHTYELQEEPGEIVCIGDYGMLKQSVRILVDNASKYTNEGDTISLRVGVNRERLCPYVSVQDNGIGMSSEDVQHIFERFYRSDVARNSKTGGTGLGLSIAKWIIDRHKGVIEVKSRQEIGTRFTIFLPDAGVAEVGKVN